MEFKIVFNSYFFNINFHSFCIFDENYQSNQKHFLISKNRCTTHVTIFVIFFDVLFSSLSFFFLLKYSKIFDIILFCSQLFDFLLFSSTLRENLKINLLFSSIFFSFVLFVILLFEKSDLFIEQQKLVFACFKSLSCFRKFLIFYEPFFNFFIKKTF